MNNTRKFAIAIASIAAAGAISFGAVASAAGTSPIAGKGADTSVSAPHRCERQTEITQRVTTAKQRIDQRLATLQANKTKADAAGHTARSARIQARIDRLTAAETRIDTRYSKFEAWAQTHCSASPTTVTTSAGA